MTPEQSKMTRGEFVLQIDELAKQVKRLEHEKVGLKEQVAALTKRLKDKDADLLDEFADALRMGARRRDRKGVGSERREIGVLPVFVAHRRDALREEAIERVPAELRDRWGLGPGAARGGRRVKKANEDIDFFPQLNRILQQNQ